MVLARTFFKEENMKIDLHCHTLNTVQGDGEKRNVTAEKFKKVIGENDIKIVAITNHNTFDRSNFNILSTSVLGLCSIWPGIELTVNVKGEVGHLIIVASPSYIDIFESIINTLTSGKNADDVEVDYNSLKSVFQSDKVIYIAHYLGKSKSFTESSISELGKILSEDDIVLLEPSNSTTMGILLNHDYKSIIGSDVKDWDNYPIKKIPTLRVSLSDFSSFRLLAKRDKQIVESLLFDKGEITLNLESYWNKELSLYKDINVVFGGKGTGKSEFLKEVSKQFKKLGNYTINYYDSSNSKSSFSDLVKVKFDGKELERFSTNDCKDIILSVKDWKIDNPAKIKEYMNWFESNKKSKLKDNFCFIDMEQSDNPSSEGLLNSCNDYMSVFSGIALINTVNLMNYVNEDVFNETTKIHDQLLIAIDNQVKKSFLDYYAMILLNKTIDIMKKQIELKKEIKTKPLSIGLFSHYNKHIEMQNHMDTLLEILNKDDKVEHVKLGEISNKGSIYLEKKLVINPKSKETSLKYNNLTITKIKNTVRKIEICNHKLFTSELPEAKESLRDAFVEYDITSFKDFVGRKSKIVLDDKKTEYSPSNGEEHMLMLNNQILQDFDVYLLDEPEASLGSEYVSKIILPQIKEQIRLGKIFVIVTHNSNIGVRLLPYQTIYMNYNNLSNEYKSFVGNPFTNELINMQKEDDCLVWSNVAQETLEGGIDSFIERRNIYERN